MGKLATLQQVDEHATNLVSGYRDPELVGVNEIIPIVTTTKESGVFTEFGPDASVVQQGLEVGLGGARKRIDMTVAQGDYKVGKHGIEVPYYDDEADAIAEQDKQRYEDKKATLGEQVLQLSMEYTICTYLQNPANFAGSATVALTGTDRWDDKLNSDPFGDLAGWLEAQSDIHGVDEDQLDVWVGPRVSRFLKEHPQAKDNVKYVGKNPSLESIAAAVGCRSIKKLKGRHAVQFDPRDPKATVFARLWGNIVLVGRKIDSPSPIDPLFGCIARREGYPFVKNYRDEKHDATIYATTDKWGLSIRSNNRLFLATTVVNP